MYGIDLWLCVAKMGKKSLEKWFWDLYFFKLLLFVLDEDGYFFFWFLLFSTPNNLNMHNVLLHLSFRTNGKMLKQIDIFI